MKRLCALELTTETMWTHYFFKSAKTNRNPNICIYSESDSIATANTVVSQLTLLDQLFHLSLSVSVSLCLSPLQYYKRRLLIHFSLIEKQTTCILLILITLEIRSWSNQYKVISINILARGNNRILWDGSISHLIYIQSDALPTAPHGPYSWLWITFNPLTRTSFLWLHPSCRTAG